MNIYKFEWKSGETEWVLAPTKKEAKDFYLSYTMCVDIEDCEISRIPKKDWDKLYLIDPESPEPDDDEIYNKEDYRSGYKIISNFKDFVEGMTSCEMIASTEF